MWSAILRDQLCVTSDEFWRCVQDGEVPARDVRVTEPPVAAIPLGVVVQLKRLVGLDDAEIAEMTKDEAVDRLNAHWGDPG
ncbi:hypothetical protein JAV76_11745 [Sanguibacter sp. YZGR15]|uniref:Cytotoxic translational repressor of toxin-antitoxin stability system n=2 Tax=Sanguibacter suaedae TaxID=2795737 RepID=A0A934IC64_9MICO|nr:hypothetical protein [Sanguibacter suaedae]